MHVHHSVRHLALLVPLVLTMTALTPLAPATAVTACNNSSTFCIDLATTASVPGTTSPETRAAAAADVTLALSNTTNPHRNTLDLWFKTLGVQFLDSNEHGPALTASAQLPHNLLLAGSAGGCSPGGDSLFSTCTAGRGTALVNITGTGSFDGVRDATFGVHRIVNVNPTTVPGARTQYEASYTLCISTPLGSCSPSTSGTFTLAAGQPVDGQSSLNFDATSTSTFSASGFNGTADASLDSLSLALKGRSSTLGTGAAAGGDFTVLRLPSTCPLAVTTVGAIARGGQTAVGYDGITMTGCPTATGLTATQTTPLRTTLTASATTPLAPERSIAAYRWTFGDGSTARTTTATTTHAYALSRPRTISVIAEDSAGALSAPRTITLKGVSLSAALSPSTVTFGQKATFGGVLKDFASATALGGRRVTVFRCRTDGTSCAYLANLTTASTGKWALAVTSSSGALYKASYAGGPGYVGTTTSVRAFVRTAISLAASRTSAPVGAFVTLSGKVAPTHAGKPVLIQRYLNGAWATIATRTLSSTSTYSYVFRTTSRGAMYFQIVKPADADHVIATSHPVIISVT